MISDQAAGDKLPLDEAADREIRVLLIEDNKADATLMRHHLASIPGREYRLTWVQTREEAEAALRGDFDVCLLDYLLPGYTGLDLLENLDTSALAGPVILITDHADPTLDERALERGIADFLPKSEALSPVLDRCIRYACRQFGDQKRLRHLAEHDPLTGLLNRHTFMSRVQEYLAADCQTDSYLLYVDLDGFKTVNDNWGHDVGDLALRHAAAQLREAVGPEPLLARYGGDELVSAVRCQPEDSIEALAERVLSFMREPMRRAGGSIVTTASIGIGRLAQDTNDVLETIRQADRAMFAAKRAGRDTYESHSSSAPVFVRLRAELETDLRHALEHEGLHMVYQPQVNLRTNRLVGAEALLRWSDANHGEVDPCKFIPLAEACGMIRQLTRWSLKTSLQTLSRWQHDLPPNFRLAVNVSPAQFLNPEFPLLVARLLQEHHVPSKFLRLEITESFFLYDGATPQLEALRDQGISLALDDFGTGYSCLTQLARLPIDTLKLDQSFVHEMSKDERSARLVRTILSIGQDLGMTVIAEGVETSEQTRMLTEYGCECLQGFAYSAGERFEEFQKRLAGKSNATPG